MANVGVDAKKLEGRADNESGRPAVQPRDFFWDSLTLFLVGTILALSAIDVVFEWVRGSRVHCFFNQSAVSSQSLIIVSQYVNDKCAKSLPPAEYLPAFIAVHAILVLAPHYVWVNAYVAKMDSFFRLTSSLSRIRDPSTGDYPERNYVIFKQLDPSSSDCYCSNWMYYMYLAKLFLQIILSMGGIGLVAGIHRNFDETFPCPGNGTELMSDDWPLEGEGAWCVFTTLRLLHKVWIVYFTLLSLAIICLTLAFIWLVAIHPQELGAEKAAKFSFQTSIPFHYYRHPLRLFNKLAFLKTETMYGLCSLVPTFSSRCYHIRTDYDFLLVKLFRTDRGLAHVLREVHLLQLLKGENDLELTRVSINKIVNDDKNMNKDKKDGLRASLNEEGLGWNNVEKIQHQQLEPTTQGLELPKTLRGVVLGLAAYCPGSKYMKKPPTVLSGALCIVFDTEALGIAGALARVFKRVAVLNFSKHYADYDNPVKINTNHQQVLSLTVPHDIVMTGHMIETTTTITTTLQEKKEINMQRSASDIFFRERVDEIWQRNYIYYKRMENLGKSVKSELKKLTEKQYYTDFIVIGPITTHKQKATINMFLRKKDAFFTKKAILLMIIPVEISGVKLDTDEFFIPFGFRGLKHVTTRPTREHVTFSWPPKSHTTETESLEHDWVLNVGDTESRLRFHLYEYEGKDGHGQVGGGSRPVQRPAGVASTGAITPAAAQPEEHHDGDSDTSSDQELIVQAEKHT